jgi:hypothetical protein
MECGYATDKARRDRDKKLANLPVENVFVLSKRVSDSLRPNLSAAELSAAFGALRYCSLVLVFTPQWRTARRAARVKLEFGSHWVRTAPMYCG